MNIIAEKEILTKYSSFDKTLPNKVYKCTGISVRFYEMGGRQVLRGKKGRDLGTVPLF